MSSKKLPDYLLAAKRFPEMPMWHQTQLLKGASHERDMLACLEGTLAGDLISGTHRVFGTSPAFMTVTLLSFVSSYIAGGLQLDRGSLLGNDTLNLWVSCIAPVGGGKTPIFNFLLQPILEKQAVITAELEEVKTNIEFALSGLKKKKDKKTSDEVRIKEMIRWLRELKSTKASILVSGDINSKSLAAILMDSGSITSIIDAEGGVLQGPLDEGRLSKYWSGDIDSEADGDTIVGRFYVTICQGLQNDIIRDVMFRENLRLGRGFYQRMLFCATNKAQYMGASEEEKNKLEKTQGIFLSYARRLLDDLVPRFPVLQNAKMDGTLEYLAGDIDISLKSKALLSLSPAARKVVDTFYKRISSWDEPRMSSFVAKYVGGMTERVAAVFHVMMHLDKEYHEIADIKVGEQAAKAATIICWWSLTITNNLLIGANRLAGKDAYEKAENFVEGVRSFKARLLEGKASLVIKYYRFFRVLDGKPIISKEGIKHITQEKTCLVGFIQYLLDIGAIQDDLEGELDFGWYYVNPETFS